jgi:hypothetical protein
VSDLNEQDAQKLFEEVSKTFQDNDSVKLSELMKTEAGEEPAPVEDKPVEEPAEVVDTETPKGEAPPVEAEVVDDEVEEQPEQSEVEKLKEALDKATKENHALRSQAGRVPHIQRRIKELDRKLEELNKQTTSPSSQPSTKIQPKVLEALKGISETDPDLADAIAKVVAQATDGVAEDITTKEIASLQSQRAEQLQAYQEEEANRLLDMFPNAREVFKSDGWKEWKRGQTQQVVQFAESDNADDVAFAFERYANDMIARNPELRKVVDDKGTPVTPAPNAEAAQKIEAERRRKKEVAVNISNPSTPGKTSLPDDPKALFEKYSEEIRKGISG